MIKNHLFLFLFTTSISKKNNTIKNINTSKKNKDIKKNKVINGKNNNIINLNKDLEKIFNEKKTFYKEFFTLYFKIFKKNPLCFKDKKNRIEFIKIFCEENNIKGEKLYFLIYVFLSTFLNINKKQVIIDWQNNLIQEIEYTDINKYLEIIIEEAISSLALTDLTNKITKEESNKFYNIINTNSKNEINKIKKINKFMNFKDLKNNQFYISEEKLNELKNNPYLNDLFNGFINSPELTEDERRIIYNEIWPILYFLIDMDNNYFIYLNSGKIEFNMELEIFKKIIAFMDSNKFLGKFTYFHMYVFFRELYNNNIEEINNKNYIFIYINENKLDNNQLKFEKIKILDLENFKKFSRFFTSLHIVMSLLLGYNLLNEEKYNKLNFHKKEVYDFFIKQITNSEIINI